VVFNDIIRRQVEEVAPQVIDMLMKRIVPPPVNDKRCDACSLRESCLPGVVAEKQRIKRAIRELFEVNP
jgi:CRISPR-associated exonuclease Cas4